MSIATITLEDDGESCRAMLDLKGGFDTKSNAHQCAWLLIKHMDTLGKRIDEEGEEIKEVVVEG